MSAFVADQGVVSAEAINGVVAGGAGQRIVAPRAVNRAWCGRRRRSRCRRGGGRGRAEDRDVGRRDRRVALERCDQLTGPGAVAVGVIEQPAGAGVIDDAIVGVVAARCAGGRVEARITGRKVAGCADGAEAGGVELDVVPAAAEVEDLVRVRRAVFGKGVAVLAAAAGYGIIAGAALHPVVAAI